MWGKKIMRTPKKVIDKRYEDKHREERKAKNATFGTSMPRDDLQKLNAFLEANSFSKVQLIYAGWKALEGQLNTTTT